LVLCDIFMPEKEGLETIVEMCRQSPPVKVVAMSGGSTKSGSTDFLPMAKRLGATTTLAKPFDKGTLLRIVREAMHG
jgi:DNA-binding NtrC family response regulator